MRLRGSTDGGYRRGQVGTIRDKFVAATRQQTLNLRGWNQKEGYLPAVFDDAAAASRTHSESWMSKREFMSLPEDTLGQLRDFYGFPSVHKPLIDLTQTCPLGSSSYNEDDEYNNEDGEEKATFVSFWSLT